MKKTCVILLTALLMPFSSALALDKTLEAGEVWEISETTTLFELVIAEGAQIRPPENHTITLSVDGVGTAVSPGRYRGDVVLTVTPEIMLPGGPDDPFRAAVYVENGTYVAEKSVGPMVTRGSVTDTDATDIKIISREGGFNGVIVTGSEKSTYTLAGPMIILAGNGGDDATGRGHGIMVSGNAEVFIENARLYGAGAHRSAVYAGGHSIVHVNDSEIETRNGPDEAGAGEGIPWHLGITGNCRATHAVESASVYYTDTHIKSQGWGALSTDSPEKLLLTATGCLVETAESGYGACSTGNEFHTYSGCTFNAADYGVIIGGGATHVITDRTEVNSGGIGVMMHTGAGGRLVIDKGSVLNTAKDIIRVRGRGADILVDGAILNTESGVILHAMPDDTPPAGASVKDSGDVTAVFKNTVLDGDIINSRTAAGAMTVTLENATVTGAITTGSGESGHSDGFEAPYGISVTLDEKSSWTVSRSSHLTRLTIAKNRTVTAPYGYRLTMTVDGATTHPNAGTYEGDIVLNVTEL